MKKIFESKYMEEIIEVFGDSAKEVGGKHICIKMNQSEDYLPEWVFDAEESKNLVTAMQEYLNGTP